MSEGPPADHMRDARFPPGIVCQPPVQMILGCGCYGLLQHQHHPAGSRRPPVFLIRPCDAHRPYGLPIDFAIMRQLCETAGIDPP